MRALLKRDWKECRAILKAHGHFYKRFRFWYAKRSFSQTLVKSPTQSGIYRRSLIWQYFIKGKKTFRELDMKTISIDV